MSIEDKIQNMDERELKELIVQAFDSTEKSLDESHEEFQKTLLFINTLDKNIVHIKKVESGGHVMDDGKEVSKDKHGFFVVVETNELLKPIQELSENELIELLNRKLKSTIKDTEETYQQLRKTLKGLSEKKS